MYIITQIHICKVYLFTRPNAKLGETLSPPYQKAWLALSLGNHSLWVRSTDDLGQVAYSPRVMVEVFDQDSDGDGINDSEEQYTYGTYSNLTDSDGDGLSDAFEASVDFLNPAAVDNLQSFSQTLSIAGANIQYTTGGWVQVGESEIQSTSRRGMLGQEFTVTEGELYFVGLELTESIATTTTAYRLLFYVDGLYIGEHVLGLVPGQSQVARAHTPFLAPGLHRLEIIWDNVYGNRGIRIKTLSLSIKEGLNSDAYGAKDWLNPWLSKTCSLDTPTTSRISPACIEGKDEFAELSTIASGQNSWTLTRGSGSRWWTNLPLSTSADTDFTLSFQNQAYQVSGSVKWVQTNLLEADSISVRGGDSLQLTIKPDNASDGTVRLLIDGQTYEFPLSSPLAHTFSSSGTFDISGTYESLSGQITSAQMQVKVVTRAPVPEIPALVRGYGRRFFWPELATEAVVESSRVGIADVKVYQGKPSFWLTREEVEKPATLVARLGEAGPILDSLLTRGSWLRIGVDGHYDLMETLEDGTEVIETTIFLGHPDERLIYSGSTSTGGLIYADGVSSINIPFSDFDEVGMYRLRFFRPVDNTASACSHIRIYQNGNRVFSQ